MRLVAFVALVAVGAPGLAQAGDKKLPKPMSLTQRQPRDVTPHASLRDPGTPEPMSLTERQPRDVTPHASLRYPDVPEPMSLTKRQPREVGIHPWVLDAESE